jgi:hypothetical protein
MNSNDKRAVEIGGRLRADMFDSPLPVGAEIVKAQTVLLAIDDRFEASFQSSPLRRIDFDLEYRILHALSEIATAFATRRSRLAPPPSAVLTS